MKLKQTICRLKCVTVRCPHEGIQIAPYPATTCTTCEKCAVLTDKMSKLGANSHPPQIHKAGTDPKNKATVHSGLVGNCQEEFWMADMFRLYSLAGSPALCVCARQGSMIFNGAFKLKRKGRIL